MKQNKRELKVYICLFTCATSRTMHLEVVTDLSTTIFLLAFCRFVSRRSLPILMIYIHICRRRTREIVHVGGAQHCVGPQGTKWRFIPKKALWFGGYTYRSHQDGCQEDLRKGTHRLLALQTSCPLTYISDDVTDLEPLTHHTSYMEEG